MSLVLACCLVGKTANAILFDHVRQIWLTTDWTKVTTPCPQLYSHATQFFWRAKNNLGVKFLDVLTQNSALVLHTSQSSSFAVLRKTIDQDHLWLVLIEDQSKAFLSRQLRLCWAMCFYNPPGRDSNTIQHFRLTHTGLQQLKNSITLHCFAWHYVALLCMALCYFQKWRMAILPNIPFFTVLHFENAF